ncbi:MAG: hypothetical protein A2583_06870 [Bdellovibrionales bacterium RIFOXYD1_FULL_53_11]|nr:MAG: hypothetical protein A2583_06870 [Bdellovibrionales bacterium RIFOXYD1_FULL_53_11]
MPQRKPEKMKNTWIKVRDRRLVRSPVMEIVERVSRSSEDGRRHRFYFFKSSDWCNIIPVTADGKVILVRQHRAGISRHTTEIPGGVSDPGDKNMMRTALRELAEETGYVPVSGAKCRSLGWTHPNPAIQDNKCHSFAVGPVAKKKALSLDDGEMIETIEVPVEKIPALIGGKQMTHALMLNTFFFLMLKSPGGRSELVRALKKLMRRRKRHY